MVRLRQQNQNKHKRWLGSGKSVNIKCRSTTRPSTTPTFTPLPSASAYSIDHTIPPALARNVGYGQNFPGWFWNIHFWNYSWYLSTVEVNGCWLIKALKNNIWNYNSDGLVQKQCSGCSGQSTEHIGESFHWDNLFFFHKTAHSEVCGLSTVTGTFLLERHIAVKV